MCATNKQLYNSLKPLIEQSLNNSLEFTLDRAKQIGTEFAVSFREKEMYKGLTPEEIAGVASGSMMDLQYRLELEGSCGFRDLEFTCLVSLTDTCGMGADKGFKDGMKTINVSTLSAIVNASLGNKIVKHGSYGNTSSIGSTDFIDMTGSKVYQQTLDDYVECLEENNFVYSDAHESKTIHDLSHLLMGETINHIIGPMTTPVSKYTKLNRVLGINHNVSTKDIAKAYELINNKGFQKIGNVCVVAGLSKDFENEELKNSEFAKRYTILDELSPYESMLSFVVNGSYKGDYLFSPDDILLDIHESEIISKNIKEECYRDNINALKGANKERSKYLAMNSALVEFTVNYAQKENAFVDGRLNRKYMRECYDKCLEEIKSGRAFKTLKNYVAMTGGEFNEI
ncbi:hypothetical protein KY334_02040 [Candidatus Woesearchaeota archaeon]|nr:hypothetical protein [Candidatus Woesearchaeota archaeon]